MPPLPTADRTQVLHTLHHRLRTADADAAEPLSVVDAAAHTLLATVPADLWCGVMLDPSTLLDTGRLHEPGFPERVMPRLFEIEHAEQDDVDSLRALARRPTPVSLLSHSTRGNLDTSKYYREILRPLGLADELRVVLREAGRTWGLLALCRTTGSPPFTGNDLALAETVAAPATSALRRTLLVRGTDTASVADAPGLLLLDRELRIRSVSATADRWLAELPERQPYERCPYPVRAVAAKASRAEPGGPAAARSRAQTRSGGWVALHAWQLDSEGEPLTAISLGPAEPGELAALVLDAYRLTPRERDVTQLVLLGRSTTEIAGRLLVSADTVQDHLTSVFDKVGVRSRPELIAQLFFGHYAPRLGQGPLTTDGRLLPEP